MSPDGDYEELEEALDRRSAGRARKTGKPSMVVDGASNKIIVRLVVERSRGQ